MISDAERAALKTIQEMVDRERDLHKQLDMLTDFVVAVEKALGVPEGRWRRLHPADAALGDYVKAILRLQAFKKDHECDTCRHYREDIKQEDPERLGHYTGCFCGWHEKFFEVDFYCKDWCKR
jgi:hypothetical protein